MPSSIDISFIKQFEGEVHTAYQRQGSKLRGMVRTKTGIKGASTVFQRVGKGKASGKTRNGEVPPMNVGHSTVEVFMVDRYAGDWVDRLDELKTDVPERQVIANAGAYALGRETDDMITAALDATTTVAGAGTDGLTKAKILTAFDLLNAADVPDDGQRFATVGSKQWNELLNIPEFADADYVTDMNLPWLRGTQVKAWLGSYWSMYPGLPKAGNIRKCFWWHRSAVGHAIAADVSTDITWHGDRAAHFVNSMMSMGAVLIDEVGAVEIPCLES